MLEPNLVAEVPRSSNIFRQENVGKNSARRNLLSSSQRILELHQMDKGMYWPTLFYLVLLLLNSP